MVVERILAVDFDGVIHNKANPVAGRRMGPPYAETREAMLELRGDGWQLIVHTVMAVTDGGRQAVIDWLNFYEIPFDEVTSTKPNAAAYIDDRAWRHIDWPSTLRFVRSL